MEFPYSDCSSKDLCQGDLIRRSGAIDKVLERWHPRYFENKDNKYFLVLTQTCDLVRGRQKPDCKARYITLAAVRPLRSAFDRELQARSVSIDGKISVATYTDKNKLSEFLERLINNNEFGYFFLRSDPPSGIAKDYCAFLRLSIPVRASEHYETCLDSRHASLDATFQAKLGWLVGELYSRVGTPDWEAQTLRAKISSVMKTAAIWVEDKAISDLFEEIELARNQSPTPELSEKDLQRIIRNLPNRKKKVLERFGELLVASKILGDDDTQRMLRELQRDQRLTTLLK